MGVSFSQLQIVSDIAERRGVTPEKMLQLIESGLLEDLFEADPARVKRQLFRDFLSLTSPEISVAVNYDLTLLEMIKAAKIHWASKNVNQKVFPVMGSGKQKRTVKLFVKDSFSISSRQALKMMSREGFLPARHEEGLAFARDFPASQLKTSIVLLGSSENCEQSPVMILYGDNLRLLVSTEDGRNNWSGRYAFLGVKES